LKVSLPSKNLGTLGIRVNQNLYFDFFLYPYSKKPGMFIRYKANRYWVNFLEFRVRKGY